MDIKKLQTVVVDALEDVKGQEIMLFDTTGLTSLFDRIAVVSGTSNRQTKALAASVRDKVKAAGGDVVGLEGEDTGEWVLVDLGDMVVHIMQPAIRDYYRLEELWGEKEVKFGAAKRTSKRTASEDASAEETPKRRPRIAAVAVTQASLDDDDLPKKPARKTAARKTAAPKAPAGKTVRVSASKTAAPRKTAAKTATKTAAKTAVKRAPRKVAE